MSLVVHKVLKKGKSQDVGYTCLGNTDEKRDNQLLTTPKGKGVLGKMFVQDCKGNVTSI
jgi:hypothetical protein